MDRAIKLLDKSKKYVLSIDGKKIASGLGKNNTGDINLCGHKTPNLEEALKKRDEDLSLVSKIEANIDDNSQNEGIKLLPKLLTTMLQYLATTRNTEMGHRNLLQRLQKLEANNPDHAKDYQFGLDSVKAIIMTSVDWIETALYNNKQLCHVMSYLNGTDDNLFVKTVYTWTMLDMYRNC